MTPLHFGAPLKKESENLREIYVEDIMRSMAAVNDISMIWGTTFNKSIWSIETDKRIRNVTERSKTLPNVV